MKFLRWKVLFIKLDVLFCICYPILLNNVLYDMVSIINADAIFSLYNGDIEDIEFGTFLVIIFKYGIQFLSQYIKLYPTLCGHKYVICF